MGTGMWGVAAAALVLLPCMATAAGEFTNHGVAAPASRSRGAAATVDADGNRIVVIWLADYRSCWSMLVIDAATGATEQVPVDVRSEDSPFG
ncbi:MAG TPA: hypothetical protein QGH10_00870, partial [Armatimonadota bacterium]|nr:hypothetical protein [Armatimonadota bacterium]